MKQFLTKRYFLLPAALLCAVVCILVIGQLLFQEQLPTTVQTQDSPVDTAAAPVPDVLPNESTASETTSETRIHSSLPAVNQMTHKEVVLTTPEPIETLEPPPVNAAPEPEPSVDETTHALQELVDDFCAAQQGQWDVLIASLNTDSRGAARIGMEDGQAMISASVIKLFIMATVYEQIEAGLLSHDAVYRSLYSMITISDNYATNQLIALLGNGNAEAGMTTVNTYAAKLGCDSTQLNRLMLDDNGLQNYTSAADCATLLQMIYEGSCVSAAWSAEMLELLKSQTVCNRIPAGVPAEASVGNKTGDLTGICCADVGIVFSPVGDYIICAICNAPTNDYAAAEAIVSLSSQVYTLFSEAMQH